MLRDFFLMQTDMHVGRHRHVHHLRVGKLQLAHQVDVFVDRLYLQPRIEAFLLADGGDRIAFVVVGGVYERLFRQLQQFSEDRVVLRARVAVLEIGAAGAANEKRVAGEDAVAHQEAVGIVGVAGRIEHVERDTLGRELVALGDAE